MKPSARGELEITDVNKRYLNAGTLTRSSAWAAASLGLIPAPFDSLMDAGCFVRTLEQRQGMKVCCPEEIAYNMGYITPSGMRGLGPLIEEKRLRHVSGDAGRSLAPNAGFTPALAR